MLFQVAKCGVICGCLEAIKCNTLLPMCNLYLLFGKLCLVVSSFCNSTNYSSLCNPHQNDSYCVVDPNEPQSFFHMTTASLALCRWLHLSWLRIFPSCYSQTLSTVPFLQVINEAKHVHTGMLLWEPCVDAVPSLSVGDQCHQLF